MKVKAKTTKTNKFEPYVKTVEVTVESTNDELLLRKLGQLADEEELCLSNSDGEELSDNQLFTLKEDTNANDLIRDIFSQLQ